MKHLFRIGKPVLMGICFCAMAAWQVPPPPNAAPPVVSPVDTLPPVRSPEDLPSHIEYPDTIPQNWIPEIQDPADTGSHGTEINQSAQSNIETATINRTSFLDIYFNILETNCARSQCHDGNFEPNMTSPQAAYNTMVVHEIIKNAPSGEFEFRVVPADTARSLLIERLTNCCMIDGNDRMPLLMEALSDAEISMIQKWILNGCPDPYGKFPYRGY